MNTVKRYDPNYDVISPADDSMVLTHDGLFVESSAYDQLKAENEAITRQLEIANCQIYNLCQERDTLRTQLAEARELLTRYRKETPIGYQPHMIAHIADAWLEACSTQR